MNGFRAPARGGSVARSALLPEGRGLLQLLARPPPHDSQADTRVDTRAHTYTHAPRLEFNVNAASRLQTRPHRRPAPCTHPRRLGSGGQWASGGRWTGSGLDRLAGALNLGWAPSFDPSLLAPALSFAPTRCPQPSPPDPASAFISQIRPLPGILARGISVAAPEARLLYPGQAAWK